MTSQLSSHHRLTIEKIFHHPTWGNVEWRRALSMLGNIGTVAEERNGKVVLTLRPETEVFAAPRGKDIDAPLAVYLRRMLTHAGFGPGGEAPVPDTRHRNHGDGQWGKPS